MKLGGFKTKNRKRQEGENANSKITYQELFDAAEFFEEDPRARSNDWVLARKFVDWKNLHNMPTKEIIERVIRFLDSWGCYDRSIEDRQTIHTGLRQDWDWANICSESNISDTPHFRLQF